MDASELTYLLKNPDKIKGYHINSLEEITQEFPFFQAAKAIQLKALNNSKSFKYNQALKNTAAYTIDRNVLFNFITSPVFANNSAITPQEPEEIKVMEAETVDGKLIPLEKSQEIEEKSASTILKIGEPIAFNSTEAHSFNEWMQLISHTPISRPLEGVKTIQEKSDTDTKNHLIDRFIEKNPKIKPVNKNFKSTDISAESSEHNESLMTETLAKVYLEQKKYDNAIKAYHILSLKYPEKSGFFANQINAIKIIQKNKS